MTIELVVLKINKPLILHHARDQPLAHAAGFIGRIAPVRVKHNMLLRERVRGPILPPGGPHQVPPALMRFTVASISAGGV